MTYDDKVRNILIEHNETIAHMKRCAIMAKKFANYLDYSRKETEILEKCALLHDIGKLFLPTEILYKKGKLTQNEFNIIKSHTSFIAPKMYGKDVQETILYHHERPDGEGYRKVPYDEVPKYARIVSLIDVFDVMSNYRCYKDNVSDISGIIAEIKGNIDKQFDKEYGELFILFLESTYVERKELLI